MTYYVSSGTLNSTNSTQLSKEAASEIRLCTYVGRSVELLAGRRGTGADEQHLLAAAVVDGRRHRVLHGSRRQGRVDGGRGAARRPSGRRCRRRVRRRGVIRRVAGPVRQHVTSSLQSSPSSLSTTNFHHKTQNRKVWAYYTYSKNNRTVVLIETLFVLLTPK